ncbi:MAG: hypothetical protein L0Z50_07330 [Verrucomicrobiales bacterium]|nr:hypothetical protein [Verrucomicrobiales bacterium]
MLESDRRSITRQESIYRIAELIETRPNTSDGVQLRRFLWSLYNMHHVINLWSLVSRIAREPADCVVRVMQSAFAGELSQNHIRRALIASGEISRWEQNYVDDEVAEHIEGAQLALNAALRNLSPSREHAELVSIAKKLERLGRKISTIPHKR